MTAKTKPPETDPRLWVDRVVDTARTGRQLDSETA
jgi:hypothetical protein